MIDTAEPGAWESPDILGVGRVQRETADEAGRGEVFHVRAAEAPAVRQPELAAEPAGADADELDIPGIFAAGQLIGQLMESWPG